MLSKFYMHIPLHSMLGGGGERAISKANHGITLIDFSVWKPQHFIKLSQAV